MALEEEGYTTELIARDAVGLIEGHDLRRPLFLLFAFNAPHAPFQVPDKCTAAYSHRQGASRRYAGMVAAMEEAIGRIVAAVDQRGMTADTLFVFSSDNGGPAPGEITDNGPWRGGKGSLYEGGVRVAACAAWKGRIPAGVVVDEPLHMVDWLPTFAGLAGVPLEGLPALDGRDAWKTLADGGPSPHDCILLNAAAPSGNVVQGGAAVWAGRWKLMLEGDPRAPGGETRLFDLAADQGETSDVPPQHPETVATLLASLRAFSESAVEPLSFGTAPPPGFQVPKVWGACPP